MRVRQLNRPARRTGSTKSTTPLLSARLASGAAVLALLVSPGFGASVAWASGPSPDPAPQAAGSSSSGSPAPDPAPQTASQHSTGSASSSQSLAPVVSNSASSGVGVGSSGSLETQTEPHPSTTVTPTIAATPVIRRPTRRATRHVQRQPHLVSFSARELVSPWRLNPFASSTAIAARTVGSSRNGLLLLFAAVALAVLALASGSLMRQLTRMNRELGTG